MSIRAKVRRTAKWGGLAATVLVAGVYVGVWCYVSWWSPAGRSVQVSGVAAWVVMILIEVAHGGLIRLWIPLLLIAAPTAWLWWRDRRVPPGHCTKCRYDLTGNTSGVCPECGAAAARPRPVDGVKA